MYINNKYIYIGDMGSNFFKKNLNGYDIRSLETPGFRYYLFLYLCLESNIKLIFFG